MTDIGTLMISGVPVHWGLNTSKRLELESPTTDTGVLATVAAPQKVVRVPASVNGTQSLPRESEPF